MSYHKCTYPVVFAFEEHPSGVLRRARSEPQHFPRAVVALYERHRQATKTLRERRARWTAGRVHARKPLAAAGGRTRTCMRLPDHSIAWGSNRRPSAADLQIRWPAEQGGRGDRPCARGGLPACSCRLRSPESWAAAGGGAKGRGEVVDGRKRGMKCPPTNRFRLYAGHHNREGETCVFSG